MDRYEHDKVRMPRAPNARIVLIVAAVAVVFWIVNLIYGQSLPSEDRGLFGDMFGAVNSVFSGLAFIGVIYAILIQRYEVALARSDIEITKNILSGQEEQLNLQNKETKKQAFESTFFQLIRLFSDITNQIELSNKYKGVKGKDVFPVYLDILKQKYQPPAIRMFGEAAHEGAYEAFNRKNSAQLGHYFRTIYNIIKFIDSSDLNDKRFYSNIVRAQLSDSEAAMLFYNGLSRHGKEKFKPLMEKYALLKNVQEEDVVELSLKEQYNKDVFGN